MTPLSALLECFDQPIASESTEDAPSADYQDGFTAGQEAARAEIAAEDQQARAALAQAFSDLAFGYHEAREHILGALRPVLSALSDKVIPDLAQAGLAERVAEYLSETLEEAAVRPVEVAVAPGAAARLEAALGVDPSLPILVREDPTLSPGQALVDTGAAEALVDTDAVAAAIRDALAALIDDERMSTHG